MSPDERQMLRVALELSRKNNEVLNKLYRATLWGRAIKFVYWLLLIGVTVGSFYFLQPYFETLMGVYGGVTSTQNQVKEFFQF